MSSETNVKIKSSELYFLPATLRLPLKFGAETVNRVVCARVKITVQCGTKTASGWGETPLSAIHRSFLWKKHSKAEHEFLKT